MTLSEARKPRGNLRLLRHGDLKPQVPELEVAELSHGEGLDEASGENRENEDSRLREAKNSAVRYLANREHSRGELVAKLERKGVRRDVAFQVVDELTQDGDVSFTARVELFPEPEIQEYFGVEFDVEVDAPRLD